jgi:outer membrane protein assembly factor BamE (lipoprotein component of BamABCDE complex)
MGRNQAKPSCRRPARIAMVAVTALALAGCSPLYRNHGYVPDNAALAQVAVGADTRATVEEALGRR